MTDTQIEVAARHFCRSVGQNPDGMTRMEDPDRPGAVIERPFWHLHIGTIRDAIAIREALAAAEGAA